ncbi:hypothetical protein RUM44_007143 [Polyplax serrata]|uniref:N-acetylglucosamine-6-phosphate deacetylase n=1 Tax=Polyplax serrata TaxID=468196 RepID=A0ABR1B1R0_POLSC
MKPNACDDEILQFVNCYLLRRHQIVRDDLWIRNGRIIDPEKVFFDEKRVAKERIDCSGALICPGFIDIQINGGFGIDFSQSKSITSNDVERVAKGILAHGVTSFCPTLVTSPVEIYDKVLPIIKKRKGGKHGATILGIHLEGPFISLQKKGAHSQSHIKAFDKGMNTLLDIYGGLDNVSIVTLAPEISGSMDVIKGLVDRGIIVSLGHSEANLNQAEKAFECGASLITHLFNAMLPFHHRDPGLVGLLASDIVQNERTIYFGIIADGVHTHPTALRMAHRIHSKGLIIVTDAISALGLDEGNHTIGQKSVEIKNGCAYISGTDTLCGSIATMNSSVKYFKKATGCSVVEALEAATLHPALALNIADKKGTLNFGSDADFLFLTPELDVISTWIAGECVYQSDNVLN